MNVKQLIDTLEVNVPIIQQSYEKIKSKYIKFPDQKIYEGDYRYLLIKGGTQFFQPVPCNAILHDKTIVGASFNILSPGVEIKPHEGHRGWSDKIYRVHLCLEEAEDSALIVGDQTYYWKKHQAFYFDDTKQHYAYNRGKQTRVILLVDIARDPTDIPQPTENMYNIYGS